MVFDDGGDDGGGGDDGERLGNTRAFCKFLFHFLTQNEITIFDRVRKVAYNAKSNNKCANLHFSIRGHLCIANT